MKFLRRYFRKNGGTSAIEFAMLGPLFLIFIIGFFQVAWALYIAQAP